MPRFTPKRLEDQVIVITGASSGIGLATARLAAARGATLVLAARNHHALSDLADELLSQGVQAIHVDADVGLESDVRRIAEAAIGVFGRIDTWVNNAGVSIYGRVLDVKTDDSRRLFDTNFWGMVYGSQIAARHMREHGGVIINVASSLADRAIPLQGMYCASKHAVKGFTDALRMEIEADGLPIAVSLLKPSAIDTPYTDHAKSYLGTAPKNPPPVYAAELVARAILHAAEHPKRDIYVGGGGKLMAASGRVAPRLTDRIMERTMFAAQKTDRAQDALEAEGSLYWSSDAGRVHGRAEHRVMKRSAYTAASLHPVRTLALAAAALFGLTWGLRRARA